MKLCLLCHGINNYEPGYSQVLTDRILDDEFNQVERDIPNRVRFHEIHWGTAVFDDLLDFRKSYQLPGWSWARPYVWLARPVVRPLMDSLAWVRAYEDPDVRRKVVENVRDHIIKAGTEGFKLFDFIGHSLGTVVIVDAIATCLIAENIIQPQQVGTIITMGSPLHFWKAPRRLSGILADVPCAKWVNLFDRDDLIAGPLNRYDKRICDMEVSTGDAVTAHTGYWGSAEVATIVGGVL